MKYFSKLFAAILCLATILVACDKVDDLPAFLPGKAVVLSTSTATVAPAPADSNNIAVTLNWTSPEYSTDSASYKYVIQVDSSGRNFAKAVSKTVTGARTGSFTAKELNAILVNYGFAFNVAYSIDVRVISSQANNNEAIPSNTVKLMATPYKIPPKVELPSTSRLFITGGATTFDWTNPSPMPAVRELTRLDETTWAGIFQLNGGSAYLLLRQAGNWDDKYSVDNSSVPAPTANSGSFGFKSPNDFSGAVSGGAGWYRMVYDFQQGKYTATKVDNALSPDLYITGSATPGGWVNNPPAAQKFTQVTNGVFELTIAMVPGGEYKFLNTSGQWQPQFGGSSPTGGTFGANYGSGNDPANIPAPTVAGNYKITVNFLTEKYTVVKL